jgi:hypothetical protein
VTLPDNSAVVSDTVLLLCATDPPWQLIDVSDVHAVSSHAVPPTLDPALNPSGPMPLPAIVTLVDPLAPILARRITLADTMFTECARDTLPTRWPIVAIARRLPATPWECRLRTDVSDSQLDRSQLVIPILTAPQYPVSPIPVPCIVTLIDPVPAALDRLRMLISALDIDIARLMLPTFSPDVTNTIRLPAATCWLAPHWIDVSDCHALRSQDDRPTLLDVVYPSNPILDPYTVTLIDPDDALLLQDTTLGATTSPDTAFDALPTRDPTVKTARRLPSAPCPIVHCRHVSDTHRVCSHNVRPIRAFALLEVRPALAPDKLTVTDPVEPAFASDTRLIAAESKQCPELKLPTRPPVVSETSRLRITPCPDWHRTDESEPHDVPSQADLPNFIFTEYAPSPRLLPCKIIVVVPVDAAFPISWLLIATWSTEEARLKLPTLPPPVTEICLLAPTPVPFLQIKDVSDVQMLASHTVLPTWTVELVVSECRLDP